MDAFKNYNKAVYTTASVAYVDHLLARKSKPGRTDRVTYRVACTRLKIYGIKSKELSCERKKGKNHFKAFRAERCKNHKKDDRFPEPRKRGWWRLEEGKRKMRWKNKGWWGLDKGRGGLVDA